MFAFAFAFERWSRLRKTAVLPQRTDEAVQLVEAGRTDEALRVAQEVDAPATRILAAGLRRRG